MDEKRFTELCAAYVLDALDPDERVEFEEALRVATPERRDFFREMRHAALHLPLAAPIEAPSATVKERLMNGLQKTDAPVPPRPSGVMERIAAGLGLTVPRFAFGLSLILIIALAGYAVTLRTTVQSQRQQIVRLQDELSQKQALLNVLAAPVVEMALMNGLEVNPSGYGKIIWDPSRRVAILQLSNLPSVPADRDYQLWVIRNQTPVSAGVFSIRNDEGELFFRIDNLAETDKTIINAFAITLEPAGGVPQPTGPMYLIGNPL